MRRWSSEAFSERPFAPLQVRPHSLGQRDKLQILPPWWRQRGAANGCDWIEAEWDSCATAEEDVESLIGEV